MNRTIQQGVILIALFGSALFLMMQVNWMQVFHVKKAASTTEETLGELIWESIKRDHNRVEIPVLNRALDSMINKICGANGIDITHIKWHVVENNEINAFALPDGHLVLYSGLLLSADNAEEVAGVICHEIAHIEHDHVMQKLMKEIGLSVLLSITTGNSGGEIMGQAVKTLSSSAFDRDLEKEADLSAVDYLHAAEINSEPFAEFLFRLARQNERNNGFLSWISTHPDSEDRAAYIIEYASEPDNNFGRALSDSTWTNAKKTLLNWVEEY